MKDSHNNGTALRNFVIDHFLCMGSEGFGSFSLPVIHFLLVLLV